MKYYAPGNEPATKRKELWRGRRRGKFVVKRLPDIVAEPVRPMFKTDEAAVVPAFEIGAAA